MDGDSRGESMLQELEATTTEALIARLEQVTSAAIADAQRGMRVLHPRVRSVVPGKVVAAPAFTVRALPGSLLSVLKGLLEAPAGTVLVVDAVGDVGAGALWGELVAQEASLRGLRGIIIDGAIRDVRGLQAVGLPTFAAGVTPRLGTNPQVGLTDVVISCGEAPVAPGDWIFGDDDGLVSIAGDVLLTTLEAAEEIERRNREVAAMIAAGERLSHVLGFERYIYADQVNISVTARPEPVR